MYKPPWSTPLTKPRDFLSDNFPSVDRPGTERAHRARQVRHPLDTVPRGSRTAGNLRGDTGDLQLPGPQALHEKLQNPRVQVQADLLQHHTGQEQRGDQRFFPGQIHQPTVAHVGTGSRSRLSTDILCVQGNDEVRWFCNRNKRT